MEIDLSMKASVIEVSSGASRAQTVNHLITGVARMALYVLGAAWDRSFQCLPQDTGQGQYGFIVSDRPCTYGLVDHIHGLKQEYDAGGSPEHTNMVNTIKQSHNISNSLSMKRIKNINLNIPGRVQECIRDVAVEKDLLVLTDTKKRNGPCGWAFKASL